MLRERQLDQSSGSIRPRGPDADGSGISSAPIYARKKFIAGPATATTAMPRRGSRNFQADDRHRLGPAEHEQHAVDGQQLEDQQEAGQQDGADPVDMAQRVERQPPGQSRRVVAQRQRGVAMRRLVQGDRQDRRESPPERAGE